MIPVNFLYKTSSYYHRATEIDNLMIGSDKKAATALSVLSGLQIYYKDTYGNRSFGIQHIVQGLEEDGYQTMYIHFFGDCGPIVRHSYYSNISENFIIEDWNSVTHTEEEELISEQFSCYSLKCKYKIPDTYERILFEVEFSNPFGTKYLTEAPYTLTVEIALKEDVTSQPTKYINSFLSKDCIPYQDIKTSKLVKYDIDNWTLLSSAGYKYVKRSGSTEELLKKDKFNYILNNAFLQQNWIKGQLGYAIYVFPKGVKKTKEKCLGRGEIPLLEYKYDDFGLNKAGFCSPQKLIDYLFNGTSAEFNQYIGTQAEYNLLDFTYVSAEGNNVHLALGQEYSIVITPIWGVEADPDEEASLVLEHGQGYIRSYDILESLSDTTVISERYGASADIEIPDVIDEGSTLNIRALSMEDFWWYGDLFWEAPKKAATDPLNTRYSFAVEYAFGEQEDGSYRIKYKNDNLLTYVKPNDANVVMAHLDRSIVLNGMAETIQDTSCKLNGYVNIFTKVIDANTDKVSRTTRSGTSIHLERFFNTINGVRYPNRTGYPLKQYIRPWDINSKIKEADIANGTQPANEVKVTPITDNLVEIQMPFRSYMGLPSRYFTYKVIMHTGMGTYEGVPYEVKTEERMVDYNGKQTIVKDNLSPAPGSDIIYSFPGLESFNETLRTQTVDISVSIVPIEYSEQDDKVISLEEVITYYNQKIEYERTFGNLDINDLVSSINLDLIQLDYKYNYVNGVVARTPAEISLQPIGNGYYQQCGLEQFKIDKIHIKPTQIELWKQSEFYLEIAVETSNRAVRHYIPTQELIKEDADGKIKDIYIKLGGFNNWSIFVNNDKANPQKVNVYLRSVYNRQNSDSNIYEVKEIHTLKDKKIKEVKLTNSVKNFYEKLIKDGGVQFYWDEYEKALKDNTYNKYIWESSHTSLRIGNNTHLNAQYKNGKYQILNDNLEYMNINQVVRKGLSIFDEPHNSNKIYTSTIEGSVQNFEGQKIVDDSRNFFKVGESNIIPKNEDFSEGNRLTAIKQTRFNIEINKYENFYISGFKNTSYWEEDSLEDGSYCFIVYPTFNTKVLWEDDMDSFEGTSIEELLLDYAYVDKDNKKTLCIDVDSDVEEVLPYLQFRVYNTSFPSTTKITPLIEDESTQEYIFIENINENNGLKPEYRQRVYLDLTDYFNMSLNTKHKVLPSKMQIYALNSYNNFQLEREIDISFKAVLKRAFINNLFENKEYHYFDFKTKMTTNLDFEISLKKPVGFNNLDIKLLQGSNKKYFNNYFVPGQKNNQIRIQRATIIREGLNDLSADGYDPYAYDSYAPNYTIKWGDMIVYQSEDDADESNMANKYYVGQDIIRSRSETKTQITPEKMFKSQYYGVFTERDDSDYQQDRAGKLIWTGGNWVKHLSDKYNFAVKFRRASQDTDFVLANAFPLNHSIIAGAHWLETYPTEDWGKRTFYPEENVFVLDSFNPLRDVTIQVAADPAYDIINNNNYIILTPYEQVNTDNTGVKVYINEETHNLDLDNVKVAEIEIGEQQTIDTVIEFVLDAKDLNEEDIDE